MATSTTAPAQPVVEPLPRSGSGLRRSRQVSGLVLSAVGLPLLTAALVATTQTFALDSVLLVYILFVVVVAVVGGSLPAVVAAVASFFLANWFLTPPFRTLVVESGEQVVDLAVFLLVALTVSLTVDVAARRRVDGERSRLEARALAQLSAQPAAVSGPDIVVGQVRALFDLQVVRLVGDDDDGSGRGPVDGAVLAAAGERPSGRPTASVRLADGMRLQVWGRSLAADDVRALTGLAGVAARAVDARRLSDQAAKVRELAEVDRLRSALLVAVGHDLRSPLAAAKAATSALRDEAAQLTPQERGDLLATVESSVDALTHLVANLLDLSRLQVGALTVLTQTVTVDEVVSRALLGVPESAVRYDVPDDLPMVAVDPGLLERVVANLVDNSLRYSPPGSPVTVSASAGPAGTVRIDVVDHGPGVPADDVGRLFVAFQRLGDRSPGTGLGLGLAIARGFTEAMGGTLRPSVTPGGGLTMTVCVPAAAGAT